MRGSVEKKTSHRPEGVQEKPTTENILSYSRYINTVRADRGRTLERRADNVNNKKTNIIFLNRSGKQSLIEITVPTYERVTVEVVLPLWAPAQDGLHRKNSNSFWFHYIIACFRNVDNNSVSPIWYCNWNKIKKAKKALVFPRSHRHILHTRVLWLENKWAHLGFLDSQVTLPAPPPGSSAWIVNSHKLHTDAHTHIHRCKYTPSPWPKMGHECCP